jgi:hypothetical protein
MTATGQCLIEYETCCSNMDIHGWEELMKVARRTSYKKLVKLIKEQCPAMYENLALEFPNPWADDCKRTNTHFILVHSAIEYFFRIVS